jgi:hypothetical protein
MWIDCCSLEIDLCSMKREIKEEENDKEENPNKQINGTRCTHIISTTAADSGNEANSNSFIVLLSDISSLRVNDSQ